MTCTEAHGLYNAFHFVLRLSPLVHQRLSRLPTGPAMASGLDAETLQALSTYLHETIHWWQHIGTTHGLLKPLACLEPQNQTDLCVYGRRVP